MGIFRFGPATGHPAVADGERLHPGLVAQPVNTLSSLAYPVAAWWQLHRMARLGRRSTSRSVLAAAMTANGLGSMGFHGPGDPVSHRVHDLSLLAIVALLAEDLIATIVDDPVQLRRRVGPLALLGAGAVLNRLSRTGGPWHRPDSLLQGHAGWHLLSSAALAAWPPPGRPPTRPWPG